MCSFSQLKCASAHILATGVHVDVDDNSDDDYNSDDDSNSNDDYNSDDDYNRTLVGGAGSDDICGVITECSSAGCRANDIAVNSTSSLLTSPW